MNKDDWDIRREGRRWSHEEFDRRVNQAPEKIEFVDGIFDSERQRMTVLAMLLENLGIDKAVQFGKLEDWKAAIAEREKHKGYRCASGKAGECEIATCDPFGPVQGADVMNVKWLDPPELNRRAFAILSRELGVPETLRFFNQISLGKGNYTEERRVLFAGLTAEEYDREAAKLPKWTGPAQGSSTEVNDGPPVER